MTTVPFGDETNFSIVMFERKLRFCMIFAVSDVHLQDALAVVNSLKVEDCIVIVPEDVDLSSFIGMAEMAIKAYNYVK